RKKMLRMKHRGPHAADLSTARCRGCVLASIVQSAADRSMRRSTQHCPHIEMTAAMVRALECCTGAPDAADLLRMQQRRRLARPDRRVARAAAPQADLAAGRPWHV